MAKTFIESAKSLQQLADDYRLTVLSVRASKDEAVEIMNAIGARIQQEQERNEERRKELKAAVDDKGRSQTVRKVAALELERLEGMSPTVTQEEKALFDAKIGEANVALAELRKIKTQLSAARSDLKSKIDSDFKLSALSPLDALLLSRHVEGTQEEFDRRFKEQGAK